MHNVETIRFARELQFSPWDGRRLVLWLNGLFFGAWEKKALRYFDGILTTSEPDCAWTTHHAPAARVQLVPNGVDVDYFQAVRTPKKPLSLVFTGLMSYPPNVDAVMWFCDDIFPLLQRRLPNLRFTIVGSNPHPKVQALAHREGVMVTGQVPDIRPYLADASIFVVPLRSGGGTRLKILQAMAMECPVVSTTVGAEGLEISPGHNILLADDTEQFVQHVCTLLHSQAMADCLAKAGSQLVKEKYDWRVCLSGIEQLYDALVGSKVA
jgi:glycosyltransferase involved in cell wall biosynthesis